MSRANKQTRIGLYCIGILTSITTSTRQRQHTAQTHAKVSPSIPTTPILRTKPPNSFFTPPPPPSPQSIQHPSTSQRAQSTITQLYPPPAVPPSQDPSIHPSRRKKKKKKPAIMPARPMYQTSQIHPQATEISSRVNPPFPTPWPPLLEAQRPETTTGNWTCC